MTESIWLWVGFNVFVLAMLALDLGVFHRKAHVVSLKESLTWTFVWIGLALVFNAGVWHYAGSTKALEFFTGYLIEKSLSVDNVFVFALLFSYFAVPPLYQHKVPFWGILGALVIAGGLAILATEFIWARRAMRNAKCAVAKVRRKSGLKEWLRAAENASRREANAAAENLKRDLHNSRSCFVAADCRHGRYRG